MFRSFGALVLWLIAVAIPVQGIAAIVMPLCVPGQFARVADAALKRAGGETMHAQRGVPDAGVIEHAHEPGHGHTIAAHGAGGFTAPYADHAGHSGHGMLKCCSVGCSIAACFAPDLATHTRAPSLAPVQSEANFYPGVILDGLDRPPRRLLA